MNNQPSGLASHSVGSIYPLVLVGFGDNTWGIRRPDGLYMTGAQSRIQRTGSPVSALNFLYGGDIHWTPLRPYPGITKEAPRAVPTASAGPQRANWYGTEDDQSVDFQPAVVKPTQLGAQADAVLGSTLFELGKAQLDLAFSRDHNVRLSKEYAAARRLLSAAYQHERWLPRNLSNDIRKFLET